MVTTDGLFVLNLVFSDVSRNSTQSVSYVSTYAGIMYVHFVGIYNYYS